MRLHVLFKVVSPIVAPLVKSHMLSADMYMYLKSLYPTQYDKLDMCFIRVPGTYKVESEKTIREFLEKYRFTIMFPQNLRVVRLLIKHLYSVDASHIGVEYSLFSELDVGLGVQNYGGVPVLYEYISPDSIGIALINAPDNIADNLVKQGEKVGQIGRFRSIGYGKVIMSLHRSDDLKKILQNYEQAYQNKLQAYVEKHSLAYEKLKRSRKKVQEKE